MPILHCKGGLANLVCAVTGVAGLEILVALYAFAG